MHPLSSSPIKVLICDDSIIVRSVLKKALSEDPLITVVGEAGDPFEARDKIIELNPDVLTLDIEMPRMDGLSFLKIIMKERPMPVIIISSLSQYGSEIALEALNLGAVDVMAKPGGSFSVGHLSKQVGEKIKAAHLARNGRAHRPRPAPESVASPRANVFDRQFPNDSLILLGASTGGTEALKSLLTRLPDGLPPILIVQHIPPGFSKAFADRMDSLCPFKVWEGKEGDRAERGTAIVAPGDFHMITRRDTRGFTVSLSQTNPVWHQRPAVDVLFNSATKLNPKHILVGLLTGMGKDGAEGMLNLRKLGARTFAQDEASCVVYGMPKAAHDIGAPERMVSLSQMPTLLMSMLPKI